jgi:hypothetical protein
MTIGAKGRPRHSICEMLLRLDPSGFDDTRSAFTLALDKARTLRLRHSHWIGPVLRAGLPWRYPSSRVNPRRRPCAQDHTATNSGFLGESSPILPSNRSRISVGDRATGTAPPASMPPMEL